MILLELASLVYLGSLADRASNLWLVVSSAPAVSIPGHFFSSRALSLIGVPSSISFNLLTLLLAALTFASSLLFQVELGTYFCL